MKPKELIEYAVFVGGVVATVVAARAVADERTVAAVRGWLRDRGLGALVAD